MNELELEEKLEKHMKEKGYVLLWSELFQDHVAFYRTPEAKEKIPDKYTCYSEQELRDIFSKELFSAERLRYIHNVKKMFGTVEVVDGDAQPRMI